MLRWKQIDSRNMLGQFIEHLASSIHLQRYYCFVASLCMFLPLILMQLWGGLRFKREFKNEIDYAYGRGRQPEKQSRLADYVLCAVWIVMVLCFTIVATLVVRKCINDGFGVHEIVKKFGYANCIAYVIVIYIVQPAYCLLVYRMNSRS